MMPSRKPSRMEMMSRVKESSIERPQGLSLTKGLLKIH